ncbi:MAG TPA: serine/threonine-protein kinase [Polyangiales bacterium]|nr:serine/threonine-protein kinase [Polyangiales bacterium]
MVPEVSPLEGPAAPKRASGPEDEAGALPRVFGRYVLFDRIGKGGMAEIFLARADTALGGSRLCVVKQILPSLGHDAQFEKLLIEEAKLAARLTHGNVVQVFDLGREDDRLFIVMEYVEGYDLNQLLRAVSRQKIGLPAEFAILIVRDTLRALDYAHRIKDGGGRILGLVHRDVSPSNVLVSFEGEVKLCDFGIARAFGAQEAVGAPEHIPAQARIEGKSAYMSPEHARGQEIDARADVFAAGILLWELCAGRRLYKGSEAEMLEKARAGQVPPLPARGLPGHDKLQAVLGRALSVDRDRRFASAQEFLVALEEYAIEQRMMASQLKFAAFLGDHFGSEMLALRRERELSVREMPSEVPPLPPTNPEPESTDSGSRWREPGAVTREPILSDQSELGHFDSMPDFSSSEVEDTLARLEREHLVREERRPSRITLPPPKVLNDWLWYAAAVAILLLGVIGYLVS